MKESAKESKSPRIEVRFTGFGGQGMVVMGYIVGKAAAVYDGKNAAMTQSYGPEARGGASSTQVVISDTRIAYPYVTDVGVLVGMSQEGYNKYRTQGFETIAVAMKYDPPNYVLNYAEKSQLPFKVALDPLGELAKAFGDVKLTPTTFIIDRQGRLVTRILGKPDFAKLHALLEEKLRES